MQTLQLFAKVIKTESIFKSNQNAKLKGVGEESKVVELKIEGSPSTFRDYLV
jgi:hypothetical protein